MMISKFAKTVFLLLSFLIFIASATPAAPASIDIVSAWDKYYGLVYSGVPDGLKEGQVYEVWRNGEKIGTFKFMQVDQSFSKGQFFPDSDQLILKKKDKLQLVAEGLNPPLKKTEEKKKEKTEPQKTVSPKTTSTEGKEQKAKNRKIRKSPKKAVRVKKKKHSATKKQTVPPSAEKPEKKQLEEKESFSLVREQDIIKKDKEKKANESSRYSSRILTYSDTDSDDDKKLNKESTAKEVTDSKKKTSRFGHIIIEKTSERAIEAPPEKTTAAKPEKQNVSKHKVAKRNPSSRKTPAGKRHKKQTSPEMAEAAVSEKKTQEEKTSKPVEKKRTDRVAKTQYKQPARKKHETANTENKSKKAKLKVAKKISGPVKSKPVKANKDGYDVNEAMTVSQHLNAGDRLMAENKYQQALKHYLAVIAEEPGNEIAKKKIVLAMRSMDILSPDKKETSNSRKTSNRFGHITIEKVSETGNEQLPEEKTERLVKKEKTARKVTVAKKPAKKKAARAAKKETAHEGSKASKKKIEKKKFAEKTVVSAGTEEKIKNNNTAKRVKKKKKAVRAAKKNRKKGKAKSGDNARKQQVAKKKSEPEKSEPVKIKGSYDEEVFMTINRHLEAGNSYMVERKYPEALKHYSAVIAMDPENVIARKNMVLAMRKLDILPADAAATYDEWKEHQYKKDMGKNFNKEYPAVEQVMDVSQMENNYGVFMVGQGKYEEGILWLTKAINGNSQVAEYYRNRSVGYFYNGELYKAVDDAKKALDLGDSKARNLLLTIRDRIIAKGLEAQNR